KFRSNPAYKYHRWVLILTYACVLTACSAHRGKVLQSQHPTANHADKQRESAEPSRLFWSQRAYPDDHISSEKIRLARDHVKSMLQETANLASSTWEFI